MQPWTIACQSPLNMGFPKQEYWSGLTFPSSGDLSHPRDRICISCINRHILFHWAISEAWQEIKLQNTQTAHTAQYQKNKQPSRKKWAEDTKSFFFKKDIQMAKIHKQRCSASLFITEMQIKNTMRYHLTLVRMTIIKKSINTKW